MPLVELTRITENTFGEDAGEAPCSVNPDAVFAVFAGEQPGTVFIRFRGGRGFKLRGTYNEVRDRLGVNLVELQRRAEIEDEDQITTPLAIGFASQHVSAVFPSQMNASICVVRGFDGRGLEVRGAFNEVMDKFNSARVN